MVILLLLYICQLIYLPVRIILFTLKKPLELLIMIMHILISWLLYSSGIQIICSSTIKIFLLSQ